MLHWRHPGTRFLQKQMQNNAGSIGLNIIIMKTDVMALNCRVLTDIEVNGNHLECSLSFKCLVPLLTVVLTKISYQDKETQEVYLLRSGRSENPRLSVREPKSRHTKVVYRCSPIWSGMFEIERARHKGCMKKIIKIFCPEKRHGDGQ